MKGQEAGKSESSNKLMKQAQLSAQDLQMSVAYPSPCAGKQVLSSPTAGFMQDKYTIGLGNSLQMPQISLLSRLEVTSPEARERDERSNQTNFPYLMPSEINETTHAPFP